MHASSRVGIAKLIVTASLLIGCASGPTIRSNADPTADLTKYQTFGFYDRVAGRQGAYEDFATQYIRNAIVREM
jgi:hypothetical protein